MIFSSGYSLIIGAGHYKNVPDANIPAASHGAEVLARVLSDPGFGGYPKDQIIVVSEEQATKEAISSSLAQLAVRTNEDDNVFVFYAGYGNYEADDNYYLATYDAHPLDSRIKPDNCLTLEFLLGHIQAIRAKTLVLIIDVNISSSEFSTHGDLPSGAVPDLLSHKSNTNRAFRMADIVNLLVITSCSDDQRSWISRGPLTIFTQALIESLSGAVKLPNRLGYIDSIDLYNHLYDDVSTKAKSISKIQEPVLTVLGRQTHFFPIALYPTIDSSNQLP